MVFVNARSSFFLILQLILIASDILCNSITVALVRNDTVLLIVYLIQDIALLFGLVFVFIVFFNTTVFKAGLLVLLVRKFSGTILVSIVYMAATFGFHIWNLSIRWQRSSEYVWSDGLQALYVFQKLLAVFYYYFNKRFAFKLCDAKYYESLEWMRRHLE